MPSSAEQLVELLDLETIDLNLFRGTQPDTLLQRVFGVKLPILERRFCLVLMGTLGLTMFPLTWEDRRAVWVTLGIVIGFSQGVIAARRAAAARPIQVNLAPAKVRPWERRRGERLTARQSGAARWETRRNDSPGRGDQQR